MKRSALIAPLCLLAAGCASVATPVTLPGGESGYRINCRGSVTKCFDKASSSCPGDWEFVDPKTGEGPAAPVWEGGWHIPRVWAHPPKLVVVAKCK